MRAALYAGIRTEFGSQGPTGAVTCASSAVKFPSASSASRPRVTSALPWVADRKSSDLLAVHFTLRRWCSAAQTAKTSSG
jgi:hypothetical protein